ncbi:MAG: fibrobacter succinogenes major paralogous domain-containing protein [Bacteroidota bacterium]
MNKPNHFRIQGILFSVFFIITSLIIASCEKEIITLPTVITKTPTAITATSATIGGAIPNNGGAIIIARGICWSTSPNPDLSSSYTTDGEGKGVFTSSLTGLSPNTTYYARAYGTNNMGTAYGNELEFTTQDGISILTTIAVTEVTELTASSGGEITDDGGDAIIARGVCWNTIGEPTIMDNKTVDGSGTGMFASLITDFTKGVDYYVRSYASNSITTSYGNEVKFVKWDNKTITDIDENNYSTIEIGSQIWMAENLKTTKYNDGTPISIETDIEEWANLSTEAYCWYDNDEVTNKPDYGALYNLYAVNTGKLCPSGWHVPTYTEMNVLLDYLGGWEVAGGKLKESGTKHWFGTNTGATNESGFTGLPGGFRDYNGKFYNMRFSASFWTTTDNVSSAWYWSLLFDEIYVFHNLYHNYNYGRSVRCVRD